MESSTTVAAGLVRTLPRGSLRAKLSTTFDEDGSRSGLSFGRSIDPVSYTHLDVYKRQVPAGRAASDFVAGAAGDV